MIDLKMHRECGIFCAIMLKFNIYIEIAIFGDLPMTLNFFCNCQWCPTQTDLKLFTYKLDIVRYIFAKDLFGLYWKTEVIDIHIIANIWLFDPWRSVCWTSMIASYVQFYTILGITEAIRAKFSSSCKDIKPTLLCLIVGGSKSWGALVIFSRFSSSGGDDSKVTYLENLNNPEGNKEVMISTDSGK